MSAAGLMTLDNIKKEGIRHEQNLVKIFKDNDFTSCRLPSSSARSPDIIAGDGEAIFIIEVKTTNTNYIRINKSQIATLKRYAHDLKAKPYIAVKFLNKSNWLFLETKDLKENDKMLTLDYNRAALRGFTIEKLISNELQTRLM